MKILVVGAGGREHALVRAVEQEDVDLTVVGPEAPLVAGLVDALAARGRLAFGPSAAAGLMLTPDGGRVLNVTALGPDARSARDAAYAAAHSISFDGMQLRRDIAASADLVQM